MFLTILTTSCRRPLLLEKLGNSIIPIINKLNGRVKWKVVIDDITNEYDHVLESFQKNVFNKNLLDFSFQKNAGKFNTLITLLNSNLNSKWAVNIDDDDQIINYKFESFLNYLDNLDLDVDGLLLPRLMSNIKLLNFSQSNKKRLFSKYNHEKMSYFDFKLKFGDVDSLIFFKTNNESKFSFPNLKNNKFTAESLIWLNRFPKKTLLIYNQHILYSEYLPDGLSNSSRIKRIINSASSILVYKKFLEYEKFKITKFHLKCLINYYRFNFHARKKMEITKNIYSIVLIQFICYFLAKLLFISDIFIIKNKNKSND